jgi:hypothetical protein
LTTPYIINGEVTKAGQRAFLDSIAPGLRGTHVLILEIIDAHKIPGGIRFRLRGLTSKGDHIQLPGVYRSGLLRKMLWHATSAMSYILWNISDPLTRGPWREFDDDLVIEARHSLPGHILPHPPSKMGGWHIPREVRFLEPAC